MIGHAFKILVAIYVRKIQTSQNMASLHCTRRATSHKILSNSEQVSYGQKIVNACPIDDRVTRPLSPSVIPNDEGSELCAVDGWIYEGWEHVTGTLSKLFG